MELILYWVFVVESMFLLWGVNNKTPTSFLIFKLFKLFKMARRPLFDLLPRNSEIHNFTSVQITDRQSKVLGMGLKFRPSLRSLSAAQFDLQIKDFCRRVPLQHTFLNGAQDSDFNPRLYVPTGWNPPRENPDLEDKLFSVRQELRENIAVNIPRWRNNLTKQEREELRELKI